MRKEPALFIGLIVAILNVLLRWLQIDEVDDSVLQAVASFVLIVVGAIVTRAKVMPVATIKEAGLSPRIVEARAEDPSILTHRGE